MFAVLKQYLPYDKERFTVAEQRLFIVRSEFIASLAYLQHLVAENLAKLGQAANCPCSIFTLFILFAVLR
jgi:hypothetical protein